MQPKGFLVSCGRECLFTYRRWSEWKIRGRAHPYAVHYTSHILELLLAFHYDWENETILPGALRHFKWYQTCMVTFLYILHCMGFSVNSRWWGAVQGVDHPVCWGGRWWDRQEIVPVDFRRAFCPLEGGGGGPDILAPGLHLYICRVNIWI